MIVQAGQLKFYIELLEQENRVCTFQLNRRSKLNAVYLVITDLELEEVQQYVTSRLDELKGLYYLLQIKEMDN